MKYEMSKEFILQAHKDACGDWKQRIEMQVPELFKSKYKKGDWVKTIDCKHLMCMTEYLLNHEHGCGYGFSTDGNWFEEQEGISMNDTRLATKEEVKKALIKEAKKRGFKEGVKFKSLTVNAQGIGKYKLTVNSDWGVWTHEQGGKRLFQDGEWATIIEEAPEEITMEQLEKELGRKIKIVK